MLSTSLYSDSRLLLVYALPTPYNAESVNLWRKRGLVCAC